MERKSKITIAKTAVVLGAIPLLLWAYEYGPNPGYCGVPNENGTCTAAGCHTGTTNDPANKGSVKINFPNGMTYTPGVTQQLTVTISDPASTQVAWGFEVTPRLATNTATMAGTLASTDTHTALMCSQANLFIFEAVCLPGADPLGRCQQMSAPACPSADTALQYMEHSYTGYLSTMGTGSGTYQFNWTPPATNVGNITFYIAGNAGVGGPPTQNGDHIYATTYTVTPATAAPPPAPPAVTLAQSASGFGPFPSVAPGSWMEIFGSNLAADTRQWAGSDFTNNGTTAPTSLDGTMVTIGGQSAYVYYISPTQVNAQVPSNVSTGSQTLTVTTGGGTSAAYTINVNALEPGLLAPSSFLLNGKQYVVAQFTSDNSFVLPTGALSGYTTRPAKAGDSIVIYGVGFGPAIDSSNQTIPAGQVVAGTNQLVNAVQMQVNGVAANLTYHGLAPSQVGVYQFNLTVPTVTAGAQPLTFTQSGTPSTQTLYLSMQ
ncbi:MAG: choice-of-anchor V domain-containing protein [Bryobacteraceae bacterium]